MDKLSAYHLESAIERKPDMNIAPTRRIALSQATMRKRNEVNRGFGAATMLLVATWLGALAEPVPASERVALVIGNAKYPTLGSLRNPANDARAMASKLRDLDFELIGDKAHVDVTRREMLRLLNSLEDRLRPTKEATALVYYSGHGVSADGDNWLIPTDDGDIQYREERARLCRFGMEGRSGSPARPG